MIYHGDKEIKRIFHGDKEIIRAYQGDSLVFRSRLIEGEDYEVYEWMRFDGECFISSYIAPKWEQTIEGRIRYDKAELLALYNNGYKTENIAIINTMMDNGIGTSIITGGSTANSKLTQFINNTKNTNAYYITYLNNTITTSGIYEAYMKQLVTKNRTNHINSLVCTCKRNGVSVALNKSVSNSWGLPTTLSTRNYRIGNRFYAGLDSTGRNKCGYSCHSLRDVKIDDVAFIPCKLLRDIPGNFCSNGAAHKAGESGYIARGLFHGKTENSGGGKVTAHNGELT